MKSLLPDLPSDLIDLALNDLARVERSACYRVDMSSWHEPLGEGSKKVCHACFAGAVMAKTLDAPIDQHRYPDEFGADRGKLSALDSLRQGDVLGAMKEMERPAPPAYLEEFDIPEYSQNCRAFKLAMRKMARALRKAGL